MSSREEAAMRESTGMVERHATSSEAARAEPNLLAAVLVLTRFAEKLHKQLLACEADGQECTDFEERTER